MHSTLNLKETDDPHDGSTIAPDVVPAAWADKVLADIKRGAGGPPADQKPSTGPSIAAVAPAPAVDTTFRATATGKIHVSGDRPSGGSWTSRAVVAFMFALCSALAAAAWQHYGHTAKQMIAEWTPPFVLAASPASEKTGLTEQPGSPAVQAAAADQAAPQAAGSAQPTDGATPAALAPESAQLLQSMARDLAAMGQQVEQLKASIAELKAGQQAMSPDAARTPVAATPVATTPAATPSAARTPDIRAPEPNLRPKMSALPPRPAAPPPVRKPRPAYYPPAQSAAPPVPLAAPPPPQPEPQPQTAGRFEDEPVVRPPMPMRW
jgi:hypothetical protein